MSSTTWSWSLLLAACWSSPPSSPTQPQPEPGPEVGVFRTPIAESLSLDEMENQLYVSLWQDHGDLVLSLLCNGPCLPNVQKPYSSDAESYRSEHVRQVAPHAWEATMRGANAKSFTMRLDLRSKRRPAVDFDGRVTELRRVSSVDSPSTCFRTRRIGNRSPNRHGGSATRHPNGPLVRICPG